MPGGRDLHIIVLDCPISQPWPRFRGEPAARLSSRRRRASSTPLHEVVPEGRSLRCDQPRSSRSAICSPTSTAGRFVFARGIHRHQRAIGDDDAVEAAHTAGSVADRERIGLHSHRARTDRMEVVSVVLGNRTVEARRDLGADQLPQRLGGRELSRPLDPLRDHGQIGAPRVGEVAMIDPGRRLRVGADDVERAS